MSEVNELVKMINSLHKKMREEHPNQNWHGVVECPICKGKLHLYYSGAYNNHLWGRCETPDCMSWME